MLTDRDIIELAVPPLLVRALVESIESTDSDDPELPLRRSN